MICTQEHTLSHPPKSCQFVTVTPLRSVPHHNFLNLCKLLLSFLFLFCHQKTRFYVLPLFVGHVLHFFLFCLVFSVLKNGFSSFRIFCLPVVMYLKKCCFSSNKLERTSSAFSLSVMFLSYSVLLFFFLGEKVCEINLFSFELFFLKFLVRTFSPFTILTKKSAPKKKHLCFSVLFCFTFPFNIFLSSFFFDIFSFHLFVHPFLLSSPFFSSILLHSFFISLSQCFSLFFFSTSCFLICFSPSPFLRISFFVIKHSSFLPFDLDLFVFLLLLHPFFFISVSAFFFLKKFSVVNFFEDENVSFFSNPPVI